MTYSSSFNGRPLDGCRFENLPQGGPMLQAAPRSENELPVRVDLRSYCTTVEDQGQTNSCVANAIVGAVELLHKKAGRGTADLSRMFVYYNSRAIEKRENLDEGTYIHHAMAALLAHGVCEERMWPFQRASVNTRPTEGCFTNAMHYEAIQFARTPGTSALLSLAQELPVTFGIVLPTECYDAAREGGKIPAPESLPAQSPGGGHAMLIVGYDMEEKHFIVRNSWGAGYGDNGYIYIPFDTMQRHAHPDQFYTIGAIEQAPGLSILGEMVASGASDMAAAAQSVPTPDMSDLRAGLRSEIESRLATSKRDFASRLRGGN